MPQLGESIAEAVVVSIDVDEQATVEPDQEVMQVETDKAVMGVTVECGGKIAEIVAQLDQSYLVGAILGYLEVSPEDAARAGLDLGEPTEQADGRRRYDHCSCSICLIMPTRYAAETPRDRRRAALRPGSRFFSSTHYRRASATV